MLMEVKNHIRVIALSIKYSIMRQMLNKVTFITNILFMILNDASFIIQWIVFFNIKDNIGGYGMKQIVLLWGLAVSTYGIANILFAKAFEMPDLIVKGKLDTFLVQPKNVLLSIISSDTKISALGDIIYGYICLMIYGITIKNLILFTFFTITGGIIFTAFACIVGSLSFWIVKGDILEDLLVDAILFFDTYPETIFKSITKILLYAIVPVGLITYMPLNIMLNFSLTKLILVIIYTIIMVFLAFLIFYKGLKRYSSSNLMSSRI